MTASLCVAESSAEVGRNGLCAALEPSRHDRDALDSARGILVAAVASVGLFWLPIIIAVIRHV